MAGSYGQIIQKDGNLASNERVAECLETGGDVFECVEEMYGMIWFLAHLGVAPHVAIEEFESLQFSREGIKDMVETARRNYQEGLKVAKEVNKR